MKTLKDLATKLTCIWYFKRILNVIYMINEPAQKQLQIARKLSNILD